MNTCITSEDNTHTWFLQIVTKRKFKNNFVVIGGIADSPTACQENFDKIIGLEINAKNLKNAIFLDLINSDGVLVDCKPISLQEAQTLVGDISIDSLSENSYRNKLYDSMMRSQDRMELLECRQKLNQG